MILKIDGNEYNILDLDVVDDYSNPVAEVHLTNGSWDWFVVAGEELNSGDYYLFGLVNGFVKELGFFTLSEIVNTGAVVVDDFEAVGMYDIYDDFDLRK